MTPTPSPITVVDNLQAELATAHANLLTAAAMVKALGDALGAAGEHKNFPDLAHGAAMEFALADYEGKLSWYVCVNQDYVRSLKVTTRR